MKQSNQAAASTAAPKPEKRKIGSLLHLLQYMMRYKFRLLVILLIVIAGNLLALLVPKITGIMVDSLDIMRGGAIDFNSLIQNGIYITLVSVAVWGLSAAQNQLMLKTAQNIVVDLRHDVFQKLMRLPVSYFDNNTKGNIISIVSTDVDNISDTVSSDAITLITGFVTVVGALIMMLSINFYLTLIFVVTIPMMFLFARIISKKARRLFRIKKANFGRMCGYSEEMITAQKTIKVYGLEDYNRENFYDVSRELQESGSKAEFTSSMMMPTMNSINNLNFVSICAIGAFLVLSGKLTIGDISSFVMYSKKFSHPIIDTANIINMLQTTLAACDRVFSIINAPTEPDNAKLPEEACKKPSEIRGEIRLDHVRFSYVPDTPVLRDISLTVEPGQKIAIVGATGSGKTTIISLLLRFYDIDSGSITIDGVDIRDIPLHRLRSYFALVLQDSWLFEGSVMENIGYAAPPERREPETVRQLCRQIEVDDFIESLPDGYDTILRSDSGGLSQGQKQMLNIARTFLCDPPIFILDEATSSVDTLTESKIKIVTDKVTENKTSIIIAHRLSTILNADKIIMMKDGEIREVGTHEELMERGGLYKELYESQFASSVTF